MFPLIEIRDSIIAEDLSNEGNRVVLRTFASSPEGKRIIEDYLNSSEGPKMLRLLMPLILDHIKVPDETKDSVLRALGEQEA